MRNTGKSYPDSYVPLASRVFPALGAVLSAAVALLVYAVTLGGTYIYDDVADIRNDARLKLIRLWPTYFTTSYNGAVDNLFRPLVSLSFALQASLAGDRAVMWMHLGNWLMHAGVSLLIAILAERLYRSNVAGAVAGLLFAVMPIHVEVVAGLVGRSEMMCAIGILGALLVLLADRVTVPRALAACGFLILAIGSKEQGILLPLLVAVMALCLGVRKPIDERERQAMLFLLAAGLMLTAGYLAYRESILKFEWDRSFLDWTEQPMIRSRGADRIMVPLALIGRYAALIVWPAQLSIDYGGRFIGWYTTVRDPYLWIGCLVLAAWAAGVVAAWRRGAGASLFCLLGIGITYAMVGNFPLLIGTNFAERLMYLPTVFLCILAGHWLDRWPRPLMVGVVAILVIAGGVRSFAYARQWNDRLAFYQAQSLARPQSVRLHMLVADEEMEAGNLAAAAQADALGRATEPDYVEVWIQSGSVAMKRGRFDEAEQYLQRAMALKPNVASPWMGKLHRLEAARPQPATMR